MRPDPGTPVDASMQVSWVKRRFSAGWRVSQSRSSPQDLLFPLWRLWRIPRSLLHENIASRFRQMVEGSPDFLSWWHESCGRDGEHHFYLDFVDGAWKIPWELLIERLQEVRRDRISIVRAAGTPIPESPSIADDSLRVLIVRGGDQIRRNG